MAEEEGGQVDVSSPLALKDAGARRGSGFEVRTVRGFLSLKERWSLAVAEGDSDSGNEAGRRGLLRVELEGACAVAARVRGGLEFELGAVEDKEDDEVSDAGAVGGDAGGPCFCPLLMGW